MARPKANTEKVCVFLPLNLLEDLRREAEEKGISVSALIRMILLERKK